MVFHTIFLMLLLLRLFSLKFSPYVIYLSNADDHFLLRLFILSFSLAAKVPFSFTLVPFTSTQQTRMHAQMYTHFNAAIERKILNSECAFMKGDLYFLRRHFLSHLIYGIYIYMVTITRYRSLFKMKFC